MPGRAEALQLVLGLGLLGCGTVDPGEDYQFAQVVYDQNYFYCRVEPMLVKQGCGPGSGQDPAGGCHDSVTTFRLLPHEPIACTGIVPKGLNIPPEAQGNFQSAAGKMSPDPERAPLLTHPTRKALHPRVIFESKSPEADVIREWAKKYTSQ